MVSYELSEQLRRLEIPGRVTFMEGNGGLPKIEVNTDRSTAEIYFHGAHVTDFQKKGEAPLLFTSQFSRFTPNQPIRGGVPADTALRRLDDEVNRILERRRWLLARAAARGH